MSGVLVVIVVCVCLFNPGRAPPGQIPLTQTLGGGLKRWQSSSLGGIPVLG